MQTKNYDNWKKEWSLFHKCDAKAQKADYKE